MKKFRLAFGLLAYGVWCIRYVNALYRCETEEDLDRVSIRATLKAIAIGAVAGRVFDCIERRMK